MDFFKDTKEFLEKFGLEYAGPPRKLDDELGELRAKLLVEEVYEYAESKEAGDPARQLDALVDICYVAIGTAYLHGFDFDEAWRRVHAANMQKVRALNATDSKRGSTFDVVKPENWAPPDLSDLVAGAR